MTRITSPREVSAGARILGSKAGRGRVARRAAIIEKELRTAGTLGLLTPLGRRVCGLD